jgi:hypothetical protein
MDRALWIRRHASEDAMKRQWVYGIFGVGILAAIIWASRMGRTATDAELWASRYPEVAAARALVFARTDSVRAWDAVVNRARAHALAATVARGPAPFTLETRGDISEGTRDAFAAAFVRELAPIPTPRVPLRVLLVADSTGTNFWYSTWYLRPAVAGDPCAIVIVLRESRGQTFSPRASDRRLGICGLYARHGMPGPGIAAWLDRTQAASALADTTLPRTEATTYYDPLRWIGGGAMLQSLAHVACAAGRDEACEPAMFDPEANVQRRVQLDIPREPRLAIAYPFDMRSYPGDVTAALRQSMGPAVFAEWWTSALPPREAYEALRDEPFAAWARRYLASEIASRKAGPLRAGLPLGLGIGLMLLLAAASVWRTGRQRS